MGKLSNFLQCTLTDRVNDLDILKKEENLFKKMNFIKFWLVSSIFFLTFPFSIILCYLFMGSHLTKQLVRALIDDFFQTLIIIIILGSIMIYFLISYLASYFS